MLSRRSNSVEMTLLYDKPDYATPADEKQSRILRGANPNS
jgi:hypothetical protein